MLDRSVGRTQGLSESAPTRTAALRRQRDARPKGLGNQAALRRQPDARANGVGNQAALRRLTRMPDHGKAEAAFDKDDPRRATPPAPAVADAPAPTATPPVPSVPATPGPADEATPLQAAPAPGVPPPQAPPPAAAPPSISWAAENYSTSTDNAASTTLEQAFTPAYTATQYAAAGVWRLGLSSIGGGADIVVRTGGSRNPDTSPPTTEAEAAQAVTVMKGYYARGSRGAWHTEAASKTHELHHYREWKCSAEHFWAIAGPAICALTTPVAGVADSAAAVAAMKPAADAKITSFKAAARTYWMTLADNASSKPFAAGQAVLNGSVAAVQTLAAGKSWTVEAGTTATSGTDPPCYQPYQAYTA